MKTVRGERMKSPIFGRLYTQEELWRKVDRFRARYEQIQAKRDLRSMASLCYDIGCLYELLGEEDWKRNPFILLH
jgi:hypothetical protein